MRDWNCPTVSTCYDVQMSACRFTQAFPWRDTTNCRSATICAVCCIVACVLVVGCRKQDSPKRRARQPQTRTTEKRVTLAQFDNQRPAEVQINGYVSSKACRECHEHNHQTWWNSYHRSMTQIATPDAVIGDFDNVPFELEGHTYRLFRRDDTFWVEIDNPDAGSARITQPVVMTTGSHHMQVCWYTTGHGRVLGQLPLRYIREIGRWVPRNAAFLMPPDKPYASETARWNETCSRCHSTHPLSRPDLPSGRWDTLVGEFGISCEACHGPGEEHVRLRKAARDDGSELVNDPIVNPVSLPHRRASQVCGQCHGITMPPNMQTYVDFLTNGYHYRPGQELSESVVVVRNDQRTRDLLHELPPEDVDSHIINSFWPDGMVRVAGIEYSGLIETACYQRGKLSCFSCHALHQSPDDPRDATEWADDQLAVGMRGDQACLQCHKADQYGQTHTHHSTESSGSRCYNCHMPHTTYGLLKTMRSHKISSPNVALDLKATRPNACNLCHLDKTLAWSAQHTEMWYGHQQPALDDDQRQVASSLLWLLRGDAAQRAVTAWSMGWQPALDVSGDDWQAPFLARLLEDPYPAVRFIARRSLKQNKKFRDLDYDFVGAPEDRRRASEHVREVWSQTSSTTSARASVLLDAEGRVQAALLSRLFSERNDRRVQLAE